MKKAIFAALAGLLIGAGTAAAQTTGAPSSPTPFTISAEALLWWLKGSPAPVPLITDGRLDQPGTRVFLGGQDLDTNPNPGFRVGAGYAFTDRYGVEGSFFYLTSSTTGRSVASSGQPGSLEMRVPFFDATLPGEVVSRVSAGGLFAGSATERLSNSLLGADLNGTMRLASAPSWRVDALGGFRYLRLRETYTFDTSSPNIPPRHADVFVTKDEFDATNNFYGAQLGVRARADWGPLFLNGVLKVGFGAIVQSVDVAGRLITNDFNNFGDPETFPGGYFTPPTILGNHTRTVFGVIPEVGLNAGWRITSWASIVAGYTFMYVNNVARPANQIDRVLDVSADGTISRPRFKFNGSDFWAQGLNVGLAFNF